MVKQDDFLIVTRPVQDLKGSHIISLLEFIYYYNWIILLCNTSFIIYFIIKIVLILNTTLQTSAVLRQ